MTKFFALAVILLNATGVRADDDGKWFPFDAPELPAADSPINLRRLNEAFAGEHGMIAAKSGQFIHSGNGQPVRFWAVNGPPHEMTGDELRRCARLLASYGVNLVRVH